MKKALSLVLALLLLLSLTCALAEEDDDRIQIGRLAMSRYSEDEWNALIELDPLELDQILMFRFYDSLDAMLMALLRGDIDMIRVDANVAGYIVSRNENMEMFEPEIAMGDVAYSFGFRAEDQALRDRFDEALAILEDDGTLAWLRLEMIATNTDPELLNTLEMPYYPGAETIRVAVTGDLPPMDFIASDGTPCGFNVSLLAELSAHMGVNFELVQVSSAARAIALSTGRVDMLFWTSRPVFSEEISDLLVKDGDIPDSIILSTPYEQVPMAEIELM